MVEYSLYILEDDRSDYREIVLWNEGFIKNGVIGNFFPDIKLKIEWEQESPEKFLEVALHNKESKDNSVFLLDLSIKNARGFGAYAGQTVYDTLVDYADAAERTIIMSGNIDKFKDRCRAMIAKEVKNQSGINPTVSKLQESESGANKWKRNTLDGTNVEAPWWELVIREVYEFCQEDILERELKEGKVDGVWKEWTKMVKDFGIGKDELSIQHGFEIKNRNVETRTLDEWIDFFEGHASDLRNESFGASGIIDDFDNFLPRFIREVRTSDGSWIEENS